MGIQLFNFLTSPLTPDEMSTGGMVFFSVKDRDTFGRNDYLGECFLPLDSIPFTTTETSLQDLPQLNLSLTLPVNLNSPVLQTLEKRINDKNAVEFVKKERQKITTSVEFPNGQA